MGVRWRLSVGAALLVLTPLLAGAQGAVAARASVSEPAASASAPTPGGGLRQLPLQRDSAAADSGSMLAQAVAGTVLLALAGLALWWRKRQPGSGAFGGLRVISATRLAPGTTLHVVHWAGDELLIACSSGQASLLARRATGSPSVPADASAGSGQA